MFTKILFFGDFEVFSEALDIFDNFATLHEANEYINKNYSQWNKNSEVYEEFIELLQQRFGA